MISGHLVESARGNAASCYCKNWPGDEAVRICSTYTRYSPRIKEDSDASFRRAGLECSSDRGKPDGIVLTSYGGMRKVERLDLCLM